MRGRHGEAVMIAASTDNLTVIAASTDNLTVAPGAGGLRCAWQQGAGEEAGAQHNRARDGTTATGLGAWGAWGA